MRTVMIIILIIRNNSTRPSRLLIQIKMSALRQAHTLTVTDYIAPPWGHQPGAEAHMHARTLLILIFSLAVADVQAADRWKASGDIRFGYVSSETEARAGTTTDVDSFRTRTRLRIRGELGNNWHASGRVAARLDTNQSNEEFWLRTYAPGPAGLENGQGTIDEAYLEYRQPDSPWSVRVGRFQAAFGLDDIMKKSLDQNDSPNFDVTWTDGVWLQRATSEWAFHLLLRHNDRRGPTGTLRRPLEFSDSDSRLGLFAAVESKRELGPLVQRMVTLTWLPSSLRPLGVTDTAVEDYLAVTAKVAAEWPVSDSGTKFRLGGEIGYAPHTPRREAMNSGVGEAESVSWQTSFNFLDVWPNHDFGIVYGRVGDGWLLSSDFRPNDELLEARWVWQASPAWQLDARLRRREEIDLPAGSPGARRDDDLYVRATWRF